MSRLNLSVYRNQQLCFHVTELETHCTSSFESAAFRDEAVAFRFLANANTVSVVSVIFVGTSDNVFANFATLINILTSTNKNEAVRAFFVHRRANLQCTFEQAMEFAHRLGENQHFEEIGLDSLGFYDMQSAEAVLQSLQGKKLKRFRFCSNGVRVPQVNALLANLVRSSSTIVDLRCDLDFSGDNVKNFERQIKNNYTLLSITDSLSEYNFHFGMERLRRITRRNRDLTWKKVTNTFIECVVALFVFRIPLYIYLWIFDWFPYYNVAHAEYRKVAFLEELFRSVERRKKPFGEQS